MIPAFSDSAGGRPRSLERDVQYLRDCLSVLQAIGESVWEARLDRFDQYVKQLKEKESGS